MIIFSLKVCGHCMSTVKILNKWIELKSAKSFIQHILDIDLTNSLFL